MSTMPRLTNYTLINKALSEVTSMTDDEIKDMAFRYSYALSLLSILVSNMENTSDTASLTADVEYPIHQTIGTTLQDVKKQLR